VTVLSEPSTWSGRAVFLHAHDEFWCKYYSKNTTIISELWRIQRDPERPNPSRIDSGKTRRPENPRSCEHIAHNCGIPQDLRVSRCESGNRNENSSQVTGFLLRFASSCQDSRATCLHRITRQMCEFEFD
jgi:hypothetical protein